jgi:hypothetical protein
MVLKMKTVKKSFSLLTPAQKEVPGNVLDKYLLWHALNGHKENMELLTQTIGEENFKETYSLEKVLKEFIPLLALDTHVVQLHISNDRKTIRQKGSFDTQKKINPFRYSHGKVLFKIVFHMLLPHLQ